MLNENAHYNQHKRRPGRPCGNKNLNYVELIKAAQQLFLEQPYDKVTVRKIAAIAKVDIALVSYYFGSKEGLYRTIIRNVYAEVLADLRQIRHNPSPSSIDELCQISFDLYETNPGIHELIFNTLMYNSGPSREFLKKDILLLLTRSVAKIFDRLMERELIDPALDTTLLVEAFAGLCIRPFQIRRLLIERLGEIEADLYIRRLIKQNTILFKKMVAKI